jgi:AcrR family transcriptional regulator
MEQPQRPTSATRQESPKRRRSTTRARLLEGALEVFAERGFHGASVEDICDRAGFTRGAFYSNFASKDELVLALFQATTDRLLEQISALLPELSTQPGTLLDAVLGLLDEAAADQRQWHLISTEFTLHALRSPEAARALNEQRTMFRSQLTQLVEEISKTSGLKFSVPPEQFVRMVIALHEGARSQSLLEPTEVPAGSLEHTFLPMVLTAVTS